MTDALKNCAAAILCGGRSRRMGFDKSLLLLTPEGRLLLAALAGELAARFGEVILVCDEPDKLSALSELKPFRLVRDLLPRRGPLGAIHTALQALTWNQVFVLACDTPGLDWSIIERLKVRLDAGADLALPRRQGRAEPLYAFYTQAAAMVIAQAVAQNRLAVREIFSDLNPVYLDLPDLNSVLSPLNTPLEVRRQAHQFLGVTSLQITRYEERHSRLEEDLVIAERQVIMRLNGQPYRSLMATPQHLDYLALGLLFGEGIINDLEQVKEIRLAENRALVEVFLHNPAPPLPQESLTRVSGFGAAFFPLQTGTELPSALEDTPFPKLTPEQIYELMEEFNRSSSLFQATGAVHSVRFAQPGQPEATLTFDDVGRHNALDKLIGNLLSSRYSPAAGVILTTGRVSAEILLKTWRIGVKILISRGAPTDQGVKLARQLGLTLLGFARERGFNLYAGEERIAAGR